MDVGAILGAITGGGNAKIEIRVNPPVTDPSTAVILDHMPSWKLHRNPFWRVKHPVGDQFVLSSPATSLSGSTMIEGGPPPPDLIPESYGPGYSNMNNNPYSYTPPPLAQSAMLGQQQMQPPYSPYPPMKSSMMQSSNYAMNNNISSNSMKRDVLYAFESHSDVSGAVVLRLPMSGSGNVKKIEHLGIKVQFIGRIDMTMGIHEGRPHYDFTSLSKELAPPGMLYMPETVLPFNFKNMEKELESYRGRNVAVRYIIRVAIERKFLPPLTHEQDVWVQLIGQPPVKDDAIKMEVGIEDCLHIEFEYERRHYHLQDTILGKIHFLLVRIKIKHMELAVLRRETTGEGVAIAADGGGSGDAGAMDASNIYTETQTLVKYEIMDGAPVKGEVIPVKLCLKGIPADLTPTYTARNNRFSVRYFLNLVLVDEDDRRYFKQQEIILWRKVLG